jgi:hypothetical protein
VVMMAAQVQLEILMALLAVAVELAVLVVMV